MPALDPFTSQLMDQDPQFINFVKQQTARSMPESMYPAQQSMQPIQQSMQPATPVAQPTNLPTMPSPDRQPSDRFGPQLVSQLKGLVAPQEAKAQGFGVWGENDPLTSDSRAKARAMNRRGYVYQAPSIETAPPKLSNILSIVKDAIQPRTDIPEELQVGGIFRDPQGGYQIKLSRVYSIVPWVLDDLFEKGAENNWMRTVWYDPKEQMYHYGGFKGQEGFDYAINTLGLVPVQVQIPGNLPPNRPELRGPVWSGSAISPYGEHPSTEKVPQGALPETRPQEPLWPEYQPTESIREPQSKTESQNLLSRIRDVLIPAAQAATPQEVEEVRGTVATGSKVYNLSKVKKMSTRDILAAITKIEKKATQLYPNQTDQDRQDRAIFMALSMNQQLGKQSPFHEWEQGLKSR